MGWTRTTRVVALGAALVATLTACGGSSGPTYAQSSPSSAAEITPSVNRASPEAKAPVGDTVDGLDAFAAAFWKAAAKPDQNLVFSPLSIGYAFAMLRVGAKGDTAAQIDKAFGFPAGVAEAFNALTAGLITSTAPPVVTPAPRGTAPESPSVDSDPPPAPPVVTVANALFAQQGYALLPDFANTLGTQFGSAVQTTDFAQQQAALNAINHWADVHTAGRIKTILDQLDPATRLVLLNAVYLKASWTKAFTDAGKADFSAPDGKVSVPMMKREDEDFGYASGSTWQAVTLPYFGNRLAMRVILPKGSATPADLMTAHVLAVAARTRTAAVNVTMPSFDFGSDLNLKQLLPKLGISDAFDPAAADLSAITTVEKLFASQAVHKANITVDRLGTTASAVTALGVSATAARIPTIPPIEFRVDRPFLFEIVDTKTGAPLFVGSVANPTAT
jgi:serpin B